MPDYAEGDLVITQEDAVLEVIDRDVHGYALSLLMYTPARHGERDVIVAKEGPLAGISLSSHGHRYLPYKSHYVPGAFLLPPEAIKYHQLPELKARQAFFGDGDENLKRVVIAISAGSAVAPFSVGIGGPVLLGLSYEPLKLMIYGLKQGSEVISFMKEAGLSTKEAKKRAIRKRQWMSDEIYSLLTERKWDVAEVEGQLVRVRVVLPRQQDYRDSYSRLLRVEDGVQGEAKISDDQLGHAFPARYRVKGEVQEIIVYDEDFVGLAGIDEAVKYRGRFELVEGEQGRVKRVIIGGRDDYVLPKG
ncbi:MAG: hypothetical protein ACP5T5_02230 [Thermoprotei archaeon]|nr:hypothetical protein [TACK group archaeon]